MKRGAVYLVSQGHPGYIGVADDTRLVQAERTILRPVVLVSREAINRHSAVILVCPLVDAGAIAQVYPSDVRVRAPEGGITSDSVILTGQLRAVARTQLVRHLGELSAEVMHQIDMALRITLDLG
ncbi:MAG: mazF [Chloroflexi bacterium]|nr:mazF [Chloroflexota bacterium]